MIGSARVTGTTDEKRHQQVTKNSQNNQIVIGTSGDRMFIPCASVSMGTTNTTYALDVNGVVNASSYSTLSDYRIKTNVMDLLGSDVSVDDLHPVSYTNISTGKHEMGFLAHEVSAIFPDLVSGEKDGDHLQSIHYQSLIALLVKEIQELKQEMATR